MSVPQDPRDRDATVAHLRVDETACRGHGLCFFGSPRLFDSREDGTSVPLVDEIPAGLLDEAEAAAAACPEQAIQIIDRA